MLRAGKRKEKAPLRKAGLLTFAGAAVIIAALACMLLNLDRADEVIPNGVFSGWIAVLAAGVILCFMGFLHSERKR